MHGGAASAAFAKLIAPPGGGSPDPHPGGLIGLEHEFVVHDRGGIVDFRKIVRDIPLGGRRLDPGDVNAQRCTWGGVVTADGAEAEVALSPIRTKSGFIGVLQRSATRARAALQRALPSGVDLSGYSTHLSFSMPAALNEAASRLFLSTFAPGIMLLADRLDSPGLLVRPRPGRLELAFEYVDGAHLRGVAAYATGAAIATAAALQGRRRPLPPMVRAFGVPTGDRYGWGLARDAFGPDLLRDGRAAMLATPHGQISAQQQLEAAWDVARAALAGRSAPRDLDAADALVRGHLALPSEGALTLTTASATDAVATWPRRSAFGEVLRQRERPGYTVSAEVATWDTTVFAVTGPFRRAYAAVPRASLARFLRSLDCGRLDGVLTDYLDATPEGRRLSSWSEAVRPGLFDAIGPGQMLVATESFPAISGTSWSGTGRPGKFDAPTHWVMPPYWPLIAIGILIIGILIGIGATRGTGTTTPPSPSVAVTPDPTQTAPGVQPTPAPPRVTHFISTFSFPITTYTAEVNDPAGGGLTYAWTKSNPCGTFTFNGPVAQWNHPDSNQPGACPPEPVHPGAIAVTATDVLGRAASYTWIRGSDVGDVRP